MARPLVPPVDRLSDPSGRRALDVPLVGSHQERMQKLVKLLEDLTRLAFYGKLTVHYEAGKVTYCRKEETIRL